MIGLESYEGHEKESFRKWVWNQISTRCKSPPLWARIMYLAGPDDVDGESLSQLGYRRENMIAVDIDDQKVRKSREDGSIAICQNIGWLMSQWNDRPLDVVYLDTCSCLDWFGGFLADSGLSGILSPSTLVIVNLVRGHDTKAGKMFRDVAERMQLRLWEDKLPVGIHRGRLAYLVWQTHIQHITPHWNLRRLVDPEGFAEAMWNHAKPEFYSYRNAATTMDAVSMYALSGQVWGISGWKNGREPRQAKLTRRKLAAAKAVRTKRWQAN